MRELRAQNSSGQGKDLGVAKNRAGQHLHPHTSPFQPDPPILPHEEGMGRRTGNSIGKGREAFRVHCPMEEGGASREGPGMGKRMCRDSLSIPREETGLLWTGNATNLSSLSTYNVT